MIRFFYHMAETVSSVIFFQDYLSFVLKTRANKFEFYESFTFVCIRACVTANKYKNRVLTFSNPIFLTTAYSSAIICFGRKRGWWITCNYPRVFKEKIIEKQKEYNLRYLLDKVRTTWGKASDRLRQRANISNKNRVGRLPTSERNRKIIL
jgi:hypothetical protein